MFFVLAGIFSQIHDPEFARTILGDGYVNKTLRYIEEGDPMQVYKTVGEFDLFFKVTLNNLLVSLRVFLMGLLAGVGSFVIMMVNGIMVGTFQTFFFQQDVGWTSVLTIWQHGTIEIFSIILAGTAGFELARGILFPGTLGRLDAFRVSGRKGLIIMLGLMPCLVFSGFIEGFITRHTDVPWYLLAFTILLSLAFVIFYFVWYPRRVYKSLENPGEMNFFLQPIKATRFTKDKPLKPFVILGDSFRRMGLQRSQIIAYTFIFTLGLACLWTFVPTILQLGTANHPQTSVNLLDFWNIRAQLGMFGFHVLFFFSVFYLGQRFQYSLNQDHEYLGYYIKPFIKNKLLPIFLFSIISAFFMFSYLSSLVLIWLIPFLSGWLMFSQHYKSNLISSFQGYKQVYLSKPLAQVWMGLLTSISGFFLILLVNSFLGPLFEWFISYLLPTTYAWVDDAFKVFYAGAIILGFFLMFYMMQITTSLFFYSMNEAAFAGSLREGIKKVFTHGPEKEKKHTILNSKRMKV